MIDTGLPETRRETLRRVMAPLNRRQNMRCRIRTLILLLLGECPLTIIYFQIYNLVYMLFYAICEKFNALLTNFAGESSQFTNFMESELFTYIPYILGFFALNFIVNIISITSRKIDIFFEILISLAVWTTVFFIIAKFRKGWFDDLYIGVAIQYLLTILCMCIAEVIFYAIRFKKERAKIEHLPERP
ncbi:MAG: hypothetical protein LBL49_06665 [Clostridiales Family XIII bacterium]|nr:hypothetical protein [Clostridiales Family XIII bacterium]